ncbi:MAG: hypothetical protein GVY16_03875 [Planctomycetes bacterium]|jgi:hypothetical protein|nr:hypothetical protein [Phycisphaerae bacterium]NBB94859.1 hypothetical protein [Planctomycetota bacterium]
MSETVQHSTDSRRRAWVHFGVVAVLLGIFAVGVNPLFDAPLVELVGWVLRKEPVPWPEGVVIDSTTMRNVSLPTTIGPYERVGDGELEFKTVTLPSGEMRREPIEDGEPDGERTFKDDLLSSLKINTSLDRMRHKERTSNWYVSRIYDDPRPDRQHHKWGLDVYYYTGSADTVAHVPEICGAAGGGSVAVRRELSGSVEALPEAWSKWEDFRFRVIGIERRDTSGRSSQSRQYYVFCTNGEPGTDRLKDVRAPLADPTRRYVYFAKVQWYPLDLRGSAEETDLEATEFIETVLPAVLSQVPTPQTLERLESSP